MENLSKEAHCSDSKDLKDIIYRDIVRIKNIKNQIEDLEIIEFIGTRNQIKGINDVTEWLKRRKEEINGKS